MPGTPVHRLSFAVIPNVRVGRFPVRGYVLIISALLASHLRQRRRKLGSYDRFSGILRSDGRYVISVTSGRFLPASPTDVHAFPPGPPRESLPLATRFARHPDKLRSRTVYLEAFYTW